MMDLGTGNVSVNESTSSASTTTVPQQHPNDISGTKPPSPDVAGASSESSKNKASNVSSGGNLHSTTPPPQSKYPSYFHQQQQVYHQQLLQNSNSAPSPGYYSYTTNTQDQSQLAQPPSPGYVDFDMHARLQHSALYSRSQQYGAGNLPQLPLTPNNNGNSHINSDIASPNFLGAQRGVFNPVDASQKLDSINMPSSSGQAPPSPQMPYLNNAGQLQQPSYGAGVYQGGYTDMNDRHVPLSPQPTWNNRTMQQQMYQQALASPQYSGMGGVYATAAGAAASNMNPLRPDIQQRTQSFDETTMLPPSAISSSESLDQYSQYAQTAAGNGGALFAHHPQQWAGHPPHHGDMYSSGGGVAGTVAGQLSPVSPRLLSSNKRGGGGGSAYLPAHQMPYFHQQQHQQQQQHATTTPGPPIQTTNSNKGPDGANLFIFHIPNNFTNLDMYQLFCAYGSLLSVRIMVEKDTGRSRGFGFVSYDSPESAALAIKELNGYVIGNKRLKVQHKQIRSSDHNKSEDSNTPGWYGNSADVGICDNTEDNTIETNKTSPEAADCSENDVESSSALNHMDSIRNALPEPSS